MYRLLFVAQRLEAPKVDKALALDKLTIPSEQKLRRGFPWSFLRDFCQFGVDGFESKVKTTHVHLTSKDVLLRMSCEAHCRTG